MRRVLLGSLYAAVTLCLAWLLPIAPAPLDAQTSGCTVAGFVQLGPFKLQLQSGTCSELVGPAGPAGPAGAAGPPGAPGPAGAPAGVTFTTNTAGATALAGSCTPGALTEDATNRVLYLCEQAGTWTPFASHLVFAPPPALTATISCPPEFVLGDPAGLTCSWSTTGATAATIVSTDGHFTGGPVALNGSFTYVPTGYPWGFTPGCQQTTPPTCAPWSITYTLTATDNAGATATAHTP